MTGIDRNKIIKSEFFILLYDNDVIIGKRGKKVAVEPVNVVIGDIVYPINE